MELSPQYNLRRIVAATFIGTVGLSGCATTESTPPLPPLTVAPRPPVSLECMVRNEPLEDCDSDGVSNAADVAPWRDDNADDDGDLVANRLDKYPGLDDKNFDTDGDRIPDYLDTFLGDNNGDVDKDGVINGFDAQPFLAPPKNIVAPKAPATLTDEQLSYALLEMQMGNKLRQEVYGPQQDRDYDGIPDKVDSRPTDYTNDRDNDGSPDYYDPKPNNGNITERNDQYNPNNDEYWEK